MHPSKEHVVAAQISAKVNFDRRTIYITGEVDDEMAHKTIVALEALDKEDGDIRVFLNSGGGEEIDGYAIHDAITMCRNRVVVEGFGNIQSVAAAIFQAGDLRRIAPNATFMIHNGTVPGEEKMQQNQVVDLAEQIKRDNQKYYDILSNASQQPVDIIETWCREDRSFTAAEAVEAGFADEVIIPLKSKIPPTPRKKRSKKK